MFPNTAQLIMHNQKNQQKYLARNRKKDLAQFRKKNLTKFGGESRGIRISSRRNGNNEDSTEIPGLVLYQTLFLLLSLFHSKFSKVQDKEKKKREKFLL